MKHERKEVMERIKKSDTKLRAGRSNAALLIGRSLRTECVCYIGGVAKEKYTTLHDIALR
jgi:hypothetical protein